jgi:hypothetical protein
MKIGRRVFGHNVLRVAQKEMRVDKEADLKGVGNDKTCKMAGEFKLSE